MEAVPLQSPEALEPDSTGSGACVLLVDPDEEFRENFAQRLGRMSCRLESIPEAEDLEAILERHSPAVLILSDDGPGVNAVESVAALRASERWAHLHVFVIGNRLGPEAALRAYEEGADAVVSKTRACGMSELTARVMGAVRWVSETTEPNLSTTPDPVNGDVPDVIVVEDDPALIDVLTYALSNRGYSQVFFANGREALEGLLALETGSRPPVVLLDVDLPGLDGFRVLQELSARRPGDFQVIMATMHSSEAAQVLAIESGAVDYIVKPLNLSITLAKIDRLVQAGAAR